MKSDKAIWMCEVLAEFENIKLNWRVLKKYSEDYDLYMSGNYET